MPAGRSDDPMLGIPLLLQGWLKVSMNPNNPKGFTRVLSLEDVTNVVLAKTNT